MRILVTCEFSGRVRDVYSIDFEDAFSWEDFREWYGAA